MTDNPLYNLEAGKRMRDHLAIHQLVLTRDEIAAGRFMAVRLIDGGSDGVAYESRQAAMEHQFHADLCGYFRIPFSGPPARECAAILRYYRGVYDAGYRPSGNPNLIIPTRVEDLWSPTTLNDLRTPGRP